MNHSESNIQNSKLEERQRLLSTAFHDIETFVGGHAMRPLSLASYDVMLRTGNPLVKGKMPMTEIVDR
jgi:hypothetical protein